MAIQKMTHEQMVQWIEKVAALMQQMPETRPYQTDSTSEYIMGSNDARFWLHARTLRESFNRFAYDALGCEQAEPLCYPKQTVPVIEVSA